MNSQEQGKSRVLTTRFLSPPPPPLQYFLNLAYNFNNHRFNRLQNGGWPWSWGNKLSSHIDDGCPRSRF